MTLVTYTDAFNRADGPLNVSGGSWVCNSTGQPKIVSGRCTSSATLLGQALHVASHEGPQSSQLVVKTIGSANVKVYLTAAVFNYTVTPTNILNLYAAANEPSFYVFRARADTVEIGRRNNGGTGTTLVAPAVSHTLAVDDVLKITYDPATFTVKGFVNAVEVISFTETNPALQMPDTHTRVGFFVENATEVDTWEGTWDVPDGGGPPGYGGWEFSEWSGGTAPTGSEVSLTVDGEWSGGTAPTGSITSLSVSETFEYPTDNSSLPLVQPMWSEEIRDGTGINVHYKFSGSSTNVYSNISAVTALLQELNVGWFRDRMPDAGSAGYNNQMSQAAILQTSDIGAHLSLSQAAAAGWETTDAADFAHYWGTIADRPTWKWSTGGPNEPNDSPKITSWASKLLTVIRLSHEARAAAGMEHVPICGPSLKDAEASLQSDYSTFGALNPGQYLDYGDYHRYPYGSSVTGDPTWQTYQPEANGKTPEYLQDLRTGWVTACYGKDQNYCTEGGFSNNINRTTGSVPFPDDVQAYYTERLLWSQLTPTRFGGKNIKRMFIYELLNDYPESLTDVQAWWGIVKTPSLNPAQWVKLPAFTRLKNMMALVADAGGGYHPVTNPYVPPKIRLAVSCQDNDSRFRYCVIAKRNGEVRLMYWLDKSWWDQSNGGSYIADPGEKDVTVETSTGTTVLSGTSATGGASRIVKSHVIVAGS